MHSVSALVEVINDPSSAIMKFHFSSFLGDIVLFFFVLVKFWSLVLLCFYSICYHQAISLPFFLFFLTMNSFGYGICFLWRRKFLYTFFCQLIYFKCNLLCVSLSSAGHLMMEHVGYGMLGIPSSVQGYMFQGLQIL